MTGEVLRILRLTRIDQTSDGVFGSLLVPGLDPLVTTEDDWLDNRQGKSCIPAGQYLLQRSVYHKHPELGDVFEVTHVPGRTRVLIHPGNTEEDTEACILPGTRFGLIMVKKDEDTGKASVMKKGSVNSHIAFEKIMAALQDIDTALLIIEWADGLPKADLASLMPE